MSFETDFLDYLRGLSFTERRAFDMAMGYVFAKISDLHVPLPKSGLYVLLKAANVPLGPFYNEHRDRSTLYSGLSPLSAELVLDRNPAVAFDDGWYEPNLVPPVARWMAGHGRIRFAADSVSAIGLDLTTHMPDVETRPLAIELRLNREMVAAFAITRRGWLHLEVLVPQRIVALAGSNYELEIRADRTWQPRPVNDASRDDREISIAVCNIEVRSQD